VEQVATLICKERIGKKPNRLGSNHEQERENLEYIKAMFGKYPNMKERKERKDIFVILATTV
jgi:hypothetical protein